MKRPLVNLPAFSKHDCICITGSGGKTSLLFYLERLISHTGFETAVSTTVKMFRPDNFKGAVLLSENPQKIQQALLTPAKRIYFAKQMLPHKKVQGFEPQVYAELYHAVKKRVFLCEADGSKGLSAKVYRTGEPVLPDCATKIIHIAGADLYGQVITPDNVHRLPYNRAGEVFDEFFFRERLLDYMQHLPNSNAAKWLFINKADSHRAEYAKRMAQAGADLFDEVYIGSIRERWVDACSFQ